ncbi:helix-turn-helix transcriptional regulator [Roseomonas sp. USHLN139]|uniref:helix-turn-helix transcriptional regulator n=1 Tax=Roseomonas sp. USHLN139 TaxID=3081298 RepID=UPI003B02998E
MAEDRLASLIGDIYALATGPTGERGWPDIIDDVAEMVGAQTAALHLCDARQQRTAVLAARNLPADVVADYESHFFTRDVFLQRQDPALGAHTHLSQDYLSEAELEGSELYNDLLRHRMGNAFYAAHSRGELDDKMLVLGLARPREAGPFTAEQSLLISRLWPHMLRAIRVEDRLRSSQAVAGIGFAAVDELAIGLAILKPDRRPLFMNRTARRMLLDRGGPMLQTAEGRLRLLQPGGDAMFATLLAQATVSGGAPRSGGSMRCGRADGRLAMALMLVPFQPETRGAPLGLGALPILPGPLALLMVTDPNARPNQLADQVIAMFGVTRAEAEVAASLATGLSVEEVATQRGVRLTTLRSQVQSLLAKTGTNRQGELLRLLLSLPRLAAPEG